MPKVLITREIPQIGINMLNEHKDIQIDYRKGKPLTPDELKKAIRDADAIIPVIPDQITAEIIENAKNLKLIATYSVGYDNIDLEAASKKCVYVANTPGDLTEAVSEHAVSLMLAVGRKIAISDKYCREGEYEYWDPMIFVGPKFMGKTIGIIGLGRIGQQLARICKYGSNMKVLYSDVNPHLEAERLLDAKYVSLEYLLGNSDIVSINCNLCQETKHLIGESELRLMKPFAYIINTSRGPVINEEALAFALREHWIAGAGLDVFEKEPKIHPELLKLENVVLTPHIASATWEARLQMSKMCAENVIDVLIDNKPPRFLVNKSLSAECVVSIK